jgi:hypothetical protein
MRLKIAWGDLRYDQSGFHTPTPGSLAANDL